jgi:hypothetical protein
MSHSLKNSFVTERKQSISLSMATAGKEVNGCSVDIKVLQIYYSGGFINVE